MPWVAPAVEARDDNNPVLLDRKEYSVGEAPHSGTPSLSIHRRESQRIFRYARQCRVDSEREPFTQAGPHGLIPSLRTL